METRPHGHVNEYCGCHDPKVLHSSMETRPHGHVNCTGCTACRGCTACTSCWDCYKCVGLVGARYVALGVQLTEEQYRTVMDRLSRKGES